MTKRLNVADLSSIEIAVAAWVSGCTSLLKVFEDGRNAYLDFAVKLSGIPYEKLAKDIKSTIAGVKAIAKHWRQIAKPAVLGCIYRLSGGKIIWIDGIQTKDGLWKYAEDMGIEMTQEEANNAVKVFRESYNEIPQMWYALEKAVADVLKGERTIRELGPDNCIKIDKLTLKDKLTGERRIILRIQLPSGRYLHYVDAKIEPRKMPWQRTETVDGKAVMVDVYKDCLVYAGTNQTTKQWDEVTSHGGKIFENIVQGIARDVLAESLLVFENEAELPVIGHVHDEGITEVEDDLISPGLSQMLQIMSRPIKWAPGLPLSADGFEGKYYHK